MNKPGYKSSEFWMSLAAVLVGAVMASGVLPDGSLWIKIVGMVATILGALGYTASRGFVKGKEIAAVKELGAMDPSRPSAPTSPPSP